MTLAIGWWIAPALVHVIVAAWLANEWRFIARQWPRLSERRTFQTMATSAAANVILSAWLLWSLFA